MQTHLNRQRKGVNGIFGIDGTGYRACARSFTGAGHRTLFAGLIPGTANVVGAAAHLFGHVEGQLAVTRLVVRVKVSVAVALPHVCQGERERERGRPTQT